MTAAGVVVIHYFPESRGQWGSQVIGAKARVLDNEVIKLIT